MFDEAKAIVYAVIAAVVLAAIGYLVYSYDSTQKENKTLTTQVTVQKVEIKDAKNTIVVQKASGAVTAAVITHHDAVSKTVAKKFDDVARHEQAQLDAIANQPATPNAPSEPSTLPPTPQAQQVSAVHIAAVWDNYCLAAPAAAECQASPKETAQ